MARISKEREIEQYYFCYMLPYKNGALEIDKPPSIQTQLDSDYLNILVLSEIDFIVPFESAENDENNGITFVICCHTTMWI